MRSAGPKKPVTLASKPLKRKAPVATEEEDEPQNDEDQPGMAKEDAAPAPRRVAPGGKRPAPARAQPVEDDEPLPDDPKKAEAELKRRERVAKTNELRELIQPIENNRIDVNGRIKAAPAIRLRDVNPNDISIGDTAKKPKADQAMYYFDHKFKGIVGPTIQVEGRLTHTPLLSEFGSVDYCIEIDDPKEQEILFEWSRRFEQLFKNTALERKWKFAGDANVLAKIKYNDFVLRQNARDESVRARFPTVDNLPADLIDPETGKKIECFPPRFKASLVMKKNEVNTDVMDETDTQINPFDFKKGNRVRMAVRMGYGYYKALARQADFGIPRKLLIIKRLDQEEFETSQTKRTRWAEDNPASDTKEGVDAALPPSENKRPSLVTEETEPVAVALLNGYRQRIQQQLGLAAAPKTTAPVSAPAPSSAASIVPTTTAASETKAVTAIPSAAHPPAASKPAEASKSAAASSEAPKAAATAEKVVAPSKK